jgi:hypothetical protein
MENDFNNPQEAIKKKKKTKGVTNENQGVELILFRVTLSNHTRLSGIADSKS